MNLEKMMVYFIYYIFDILINLDALSSILKSDALVSTEETRSFKNSIEKNLKVNK
jgi:hypothetical protein